MTDTSILKMLHVRVFNESTLHLQFATTSYTKFHVLNIELFDWLT